MEERGYASWPFEKLLDAFDEKRNDNVALLRGLSSEQLARVADHAEAGEISVSDLAHYAAVHDLTHLRQIASMLRAQLAPRTGNMARYIEE